MCVFLSHLTILLCRYNENLLSWDDGRETGYKICVTGSHFVIFLVWRERPKFNRLPSLFIEESVIIKERGDSHRGSRWLYLLVFGFPVESLTLSLFDPSLGLSFSCASLSLRGTRSQSFPLFSQTLMSSVLLFVSEIVESSVCVVRRLHSNWEEVPLLSFSVTDDLLPTEGSFCYVKRVSPSLRQKRRLIDDLNRQQVSSGIRRGREGHNGV